MSIKKVWIWIFTVIALTLIMMPASGFAGQGKAADTTHLGVSQDNMVSLIYSDGGIGGIFKRLLPNGSISPPASFPDDPFIVPQGTALIVTDIDFSPPAGYPNGVILMLCNISPPAAVAYILPGRSYNFTGGFVVPAGTGLTTGDIELSSYGIGFFIRGYLVAAP